MRLPRLSSPARRDGLLDEGVSPRFHRSSENHGGDDPRDPIDLNARRGWRGFTLYCIHAFILVKDMREHEKEKSHLYDYVQTDKYLLGACPALT